MKQQPVQDPAHSVRKDWSETTPRGTQILES